MNINAMAKKAAATTAVSAVLAGGAVLTCSAASANGWTEAVEIAIQDLRLELSSGRLPFAAAEREPLVSQTRSIFTRPLRSPAPENGEAWRRFKGACNVHKRVHQGFTIYQALRENDYLWNNRDEIVDINDRLERVRSDVKSGSDVVRAVCKQAFS